MKTKQLRIIRCPNCGCEYLPAEIYYPGEFLGKPLNIMKDDSGKIIGFDNYSMQDTETYECDKCGSKFEVDATTNFSAKLCGVDTEHYITKLVKEKFFLEES